jgi:inorganic pyrophosphatase
MGATLAHLPARRSDGSVTVVVESPRGCACKFKYDAELEAIVLSRPLPAGVVYPHDWGFIPSTHASDGDPLDVIVMWQGISYPGVILPCRLIGVLNVEQTNRETGRRERNDRLAALPLEDKGSDGIKSVFDISARARAEVEQFFRNAVAFEGKDLELMGWSGPDEADGLVARCL